LTITTFAGIKKTNRGRKKCEAQKKNMEEKGTLDTGKGKRKHFFGGSQYGLARKKKSHEGAWGKGFWYGRQ